MARLSGPRRIRCFATQGSGSSDEARIVSLLSALEPRPLPFDRAAKARSCLRVLGALVRQRPDLVVMEGTGLAGGVAVIAARLLARVPYVISSGDAVAPFIASFHPWLRPLAERYERWLCRGCAGFIGWTPYLVGRALTLGAPRGMTAAGWAAPGVGEATGRAEVRSRLGVPADAVVFGLVGSLDWNARVGYCYGLELVRAVATVDRVDVRVMIVGGGTGRARLEREAGEMLGERVILTGAVPRERVPDMLLAMDVGSLPQSLDGVGSFRYTTKISEYVAARLPMVTGELPLAYDLDDGWMWRLPGAAPWDPAYVEALARLMTSITDDEIRTRRERIPADPALFSHLRQRRAVSAFVEDLIAAGAGR